MTMAPFGSVRIISGCWRGRLLRFPNVEGLRPTHDRIRETLFNWLMHDVEGAICLDLFAGSGALGFEALSRGAKKVIFVDNNREIIESLKKNAVELGADHFEVITANVPHNLSELPNLQYDIIFLDPPYKSGMIQPCVNWISSNGLVKKDGYIYVESEKDFINLELPDGWKIIKTSHTKSINYQLLQAH